MPRRAGARAWPTGSAAHVNALTFLGGAPKLLACDNLRVGVTAACRRGLTIGAHTYGSIVSILRTGLDRAFDDDAAAPDRAPLLHANIRVRSYYH